MAVSLAIRYEDDVAVVDASGRITLGESSIALQETLRALVTEGRKKILVNLAGVSFMDSAGIGEMVGCYVSASHKGCRIRLCELTKRVSDLLEVTRLYSVLDIQQREEDALRSFRQSR
jgi:anti-sigma B factor antagonist